MNLNSLFEEKNIFKLFLKIAIPGSLGMLASAIYQLIDGIFVSNFLGEAAFSAINLAFPFIVLIYAIADLIGVGSSVIIAIKLGEKKLDEARGLFSASILTIFIADTIIGLLTFFFAKDLIILMGAEGELLELSTEYLKIYAITLPLSGYIFALDNYLRINGMVKTSLLINISMSVFIIGFESLLIAYFHLPIWAAAFACTAGFMLFSLISFIPFFFKRSALKFQKPLFKVKLCLETGKNGLPAFLSNIASRITSIILNIILLQKGGENAVSAYGVLMYVDSFVWPLLYGMSDSLQPCIGYNYGAKRYDRVKKIAKYCFLFNMIVCLVSFILLISFPSFTSGIFIDKGNEELTKMTVIAISIYSFTYLVKWFSYTTQGFFQALGKSGLAIIISLTVSLIFPLIFIIPFSYLSLDAIWLVTPLTYLLATILSVFLLLLEKKKGLLKEERITA